jgi:hypothetical protein
MSHLTATEFVDLLDGNLDAERARHVDACAMCRRQIEDLRGALLAGLAAEQPEPSPLFWKNFSTRVREGIEAAPNHERYEWLPWVPSMLGPRALAVVAALALLVLAGFVGRVNIIRSLDRADILDRPAQSGSTAAAGDPLPDPNALDPEEAWAAASAIAEGVVWDDAAEAVFGTQPGEAERALSSLTDTERARLAALLEAELKKTGD